MKKFEYQYFNLPAMIAARRAKEEAPNVSGEVFYHKILNELGAEGWELVPQGDGFFGKREIE